MRDALELNETSLKEMHQEHHKIATAVMTTRGELETTRERIRTLRASIMRRGRELVDLCGGNPAPETVARYEQRLAKSTAELATLVGAATAERLEKSVRAWASGNLQKVEQLPETSEEPWG